MSRCGTHRYLPCILGMWLLCVPLGAMAQAQRDPLREVDSLAGVIWADSTQYRPDTPPDELWPIERDARGPYRQALAGMARAQVLGKHMEIPAGIAVLERVIGLINDGKHERALAAAYYGLSTIEMIRNNIAGGIMQSEHALRITATTPYPRLEASLQVRTGAAYQALEDYAQAGERYRSALKLHLGTGDRFWALGNLAEIAVQLGDTGEARKYVQRMKALGDSLGLYPAMVELTQGEVELGAGNPEAAIAFFKQGMARYKAARSLTFEAWALSRISAAHRAAGRWKLAQEAAREGLRLSEEHNMRKELQDNEGELYQAYAAAGNKAAAYDHYTRYIALRDTAMGTRTSALLAASMLRNQMERQARTDSLLRAEKDLRLEESHRAEMERERTQRNIFLLASLALFAFGASTLRQRNKIRKARDRSDELLLNILPEEVAEELKEKGETVARSIDQVTVLFTDFKGFTGMAEKMGAQELVNEIDTCFRAFDQILAKRGVEKIKTIGDAYMAAGGMPIPSADSARSTVLAALDMQDFMRSYKAGREAAGKPAFEMRIGIHTGPVVAGIVGVKKFQYDIWGDTVNTASRMESSGEVGRVNISGATYSLVKDLVVSSQLSGQSRTTDNQQLTTRPAFTFTPRGKVQAKGKGEMEMYFVERNDAT